MTSLARALALALFCASGGAVLADPPGDPKQVKKDETGKYFDAKGNPTFNIGPDGTIDWFTYSGFRRYHAECHVCHGPNGDGGSFAPALKESLKRFDYPEFFGIVVGGKKSSGAGIENVMPAFGENRNVMCYLDDIYVYLRARGNGFPPGRPSNKREDKLPAAAEKEDACLAGKG